MYNGIIVIRKEKGFTSHDVVAKLRGILHQKKIGHTGTLDPDAEGVLPVCLGKATKLSQLMTDHDKVYEAVMQLGVRTDTQDMSGNILSRQDPERDPGKITAAIASFQGEIMQIPPMYSAVKINGKKLYELARKGVEIDRPPRPVTIFSIEITCMDCPFVSMRVHCSSGTYIRTLCNDIGEKLGCGAALKELNRTRVGIFGLEQAFSLPEVEETARSHPQQLEDMIIPPERILGDRPKVFCLDEDADRFLYNGNYLDRKRTRSDREWVPGDKEQVRMYDSRGVFRALYRYDRGRDRYSAYIMM